MPDGPLILAVDLRNTPKGGGYGRAHTLLYIYYNNITNLMYLHITEEVSVNTVVGSIPIKPGFTYRFNTEEDLFSLDPISGVITTKGRIDRESSNIGKTGQFDLIVLSSSPTYPIEVRSLASYL